jgi:hypothetical protein
VTSQGDGDWLPIATAARRLGVTPKAIRGRIERGTIEVRAAGNRGREVLVTEPGRPRDPPRDFEVERMGRLRAEATVAAQDVLIEELRRLLADARLPWWRRWVR